MEGLTIKQTKIRTSNNHLPNSTILGQNSATFDKQEVLKPFYKLHGGLTIPFQNVLKRHMTNFQLCIKFVIISPSRIPMIVSDSLQNINIEKFSDPLSLGFVFLRFSEVMLTKTYKKTWSYHQKKVEKYWAPCILHIIFNFLLFAKWTLILVKCALIFIFDLFDFDSPCNSRSC